jgi:hypothetical protein
VLTSLSVSFPVFAMSSSFFHSRSLFAYARPGFSPPISLGEKEKKATKSTEMTHQAGA